MSARRIPVDDWRQAQHLFARWVAGVICSEYELDPPRIALVIGTVMRELLVLEARVAREIASGRESFDVDPTIRCFEIAYRAAGIDRAPKQEKGDMW